MRTLRFYLPIFILVWSIMILILVPTAFSLFFPAESDSGKDPIVITGSSVLAGAISDTTREWQTLTPLEVRIEISDSSTALQDVERRGADIGMLSRPMTFPEMTDYPDLSLTQVGYDALAVVVSKNNSVLSLSEDQVRDLFCGSIHDWGKVGGKSGLPVRVLGREAGSPDRDFFRKIALKTGIFAKDISQFKTDDEIIQAIRADKNGTTIAYLPVAEVPIDLRTLSIITSPEKTIFPTNESIADGDYPYVRSLGLVTRSDSRSDVQALMTFLTSPYGREILAKNGVIPLTQTGENSEKMQARIKYGIRIH